MAKICERILSDFLEPRCRRIMSNPDLADIFKKSAYSDNIPDEDKCQHISDKTLQQMAIEFTKQEPIKFSGTRKAAFVTSQ